jgi:hypothetical protein
MIKKVDYENSFLIIMKEIFNLFEKPFKNSNTLMNVRESLGKENGLRLIY